MSRTSDLVRLKAEEEKQDKLNAGVLDEEPKSFSPYSEAKSEWRRFLHFLCNTNDGTCLGRTDLNWVTVIIFYTVLFSTYAAFFFVALFGMYQLIHENKPRLTGSDSLLQDKPGLGFQPRLGIFHKELLESRLIWINPDDFDNVNMYAEQLRVVVDAERDERLRERAGTNDVNYSDCINGPADESETLCNVYGDGKSDGSLYWGDCTTEKSFGYPDGQPCVLIRLNRIIGWKPDDSLDEGLSDKVLSLPSSYDLKNLKGHVIIECRGQNPWDQELIGPLLLFPGNRVDTNSPGNNSTDPGPGILSIPPWYFPYTKQHGYLSPFVMVQFANPTVGVLLQVTCQAYNKNVEIDAKYGLGSVSFEILIEPET